MLKELQYLSKRRKNQLISNEIAYKKSKIHSTNSNIASDMIKKVANSNNNFTYNKINILSQNFNETSESVDESSIESLSDRASNEEHNVETQNISDINNISDCSNNTSLQEDLQKLLVIERNITHSIVNELLTILRKHGHVDLLKDVRVLLQTPRNASVNFKSVGNGRYMHFGIFSGLKRSIQIYSKFITRNNIKLNINIDGLPLSKSSGSQFWPILASIENIDVYTSFCNWHISWHVQT